MCTDNTVCTDNIFLCTVKSLVCNDNIFQECQNMDHIKSHTIFNQSPAIILFVNTWPTFLVIDLLQGYNIKIFIIWVSY